MQRKVLPLRNPVVDPAELADWDSRTGKMRQALERGDIAGILSLVVYADGTYEVISRGHLFRDRCDLNTALSLLAKSTISKP